MRERSNTTVHHDDICRHNHIDLVNHHQRPHDDHFEHDVDDIEHNHDVQYNYDVGAALYLQHYLSDEPSGYTQPG